MATVVVQIFLEVDRFDMNRDTELTRVHMDIDIQECDLGRGVVPCEVDRIATAEPFKEGDEGVKTMGLKQEYVVDTSCSYTISFGPLGAPVL